MSVIKGIEGTSKSCPRLDIFNIAKIFNRNHPETFRFIQVIVQVYSGAERNSIVTVLKELKHNL